MNRRCAWLMLICGLAAADVAAQTWTSPNFRGSVAISGRNQPTQVRFAHDGRVFVAEKPGAIWMYQNLADSAPVQIADLGGVVHSYQDRGLLGLALDPRFPEQPYLYVLYSFNGGLFADSPPRWPAADCPDPIADFAGCVISGHLSRLTLSGNQLIDEQVLIEDWYQQYPSHSIGSVRFGADGFLYVSGGDGASFVHADWGQIGNPNWPDQRSPFNEGGALRAQGLEVESLYTDQVWLNGSIARIDPRSGEGAPGNPLADTPGASPNARRIIAHGLRNPFRFTFRPGTSEPWISDVGWRGWEEINVVPQIGAQAVLHNFGWPCFEGRGAMADYQTLPLCTNLYANGNSGGRTPVTMPFYTYPRTSNKAITGIAFQAGNHWPQAYRNAVFFADYIDNSIRFIADADQDGIPDPVTDGNATMLGQGNFFAVDLVEGPGQDLFWVDINQGRIGRISWDINPTQRNLAPSAAIALGGGSVADGPPRTISFTAANSIDPESGTLSYAWDLDGDGDFNDASGISASQSYSVGDATPVVLRIGVRASDAQGASDEARMIVTIARDLIFADDFE